MLTNSDEETHGTFKKLLVISVVSGEVRIRIRHFLPEKSNVHGMSVKIISASGLHQKDPTCT